MKKQLLLLVLLILPLLASADAVEINGIYYNLNSSEKTAEVVKNPNKYSGSIIIPEYVKYEGLDYSVRHIGVAAFQYCNALTSVRMSNSITNIDGWAFFYCTSLTSVILSNNVTTIGTLAFGNCTNLHEIAIPASTNTISESAFDGCTSLTFIVIPSSVVSIGEGAFANCTSLKNVSFEDGQNKLVFNVNKPNSLYKNPQWFQNCPLDSIYIGRDMEYSFVATDNHQTYTYSPFREKESLRKVVYGDNVTVIPNEIFRSCSNLFSVETPETMDSVGDRCFYECENLSFFVIPNGIRTIGNSTFKGCKGLKAINIPETVTHINDYAFDGCEGLKKIEIPSSVMRIEGRAFGACTNLSDLTFRDGNTSLVIREAGYSSAFYGCPITSIYLGRNIVNNSYNYIYSSLGSLATPFNLKIGKYVTELKGGTFAQCEKIISITFEEGADTLTLINDHNAYNSIMPFAQSSIDSVYLGRVIVGKDAYEPNRTIIPFSNVGSSFVMQIGNNISEIGDQSYNSWNISSVTIPNNVQRIGFAAFQNCSSLKNVIIDDGENNLDFGIGDKNYSCFYGCSIDSLYLGRNLIYSQYSPFKRNTGISSVILGDNITEIGDALFSGFKYLQSIDLPKKLTKIGKQAFYGCEGLATLTIPSSVTEIGQQAFDLCRGLKTLAFEDGEEELVFTAEQNSINNAFCNSPLEKIYLGRNIVYPNVSPFFAIESIKELTLGSKVTRLNDRIFAGCPNLAEVYSYSETVPTSGESVFTESYLQNAILNVPYSLYDEYRVTNPWNKFGNIHNFEGKYNLFYLVDGEEYKKYVIDFGESITPEAEPTKEGYVFSGWSEIPETMPEHDVTINGTFSALSYKLVYLVDGIEYRTYDVSYGTAITPEAAPEKEGYSFSGWSEIPETMPAHDVTVTGTFTINKYKLTYVVDNEVYKSYELDYGATITPEAAPEKEGYTFSGWSEIPETMPACDVNITGTFTINKYKLTYMVDGEEYKSYDVEYGVNITPEQTPTKVGYTFSGWSEIPETMPAHDVTVTGSFTINQYQVTYIVDGEIFKTVYVEYASEITPPSVPEREGYSFAWNEYPETMPANDINITGQYTINSYKLSYVVDGVEYKCYDVVYNATITPEANPTKEGYTFSGWSEIPETMPAHDVTVTGSFSINSYKLTYMIDDKVYKETMYEYGATINPEPQPEGDYATFEWTGLPEKMPAHNVVVHASYTTEIIEVLMATQRNIRIYSPNGKKLNKLQKGLNIVVLDDGTVKRVVVK